jgi:hypothetical protein
LTINGTLIPTPIRIIVSIVPAGGQSRYFLEMLMRHGFNSNWLVPAHRGSGNFGSQHGAHALESALHGNVNARQNEQLNTQLWEQRRHHLQ